MTRLEALGISLGLALFGVAAAVRADELRVRPAPYGGYELVGRDGAVSEWVKPRALGRGYDRFTPDGRPIGSLEPRTFGEGYSVRDAAGRRQGWLMPESFGPGYALEDERGRVIGTIRPSSTPGEFILRGKIRER